jgi:hypothetical protein
MLLTAPAKLSVHTSGFELRRTNTRKRPAVGLDCPTAVHLKAPLASARAPRRRLRDPLLEASESIPLPNSSSSPSVRSVIKFDGMYAHYTMYELSHSPFVRIGSPGHPSQEGPPDDTKVDSEASCGSPRAESADRSHVRHCQPHANPMPTRCQPHSHSPGFSVFRREPGGPQGPGRRGRAVANTHFVQLAWVTTQHPAARFLFT